MLQHSKRRASPFLSFILSVTCSLISFSTCHIRSVKDRGDSYVRERERSTDYTHSTAFRVCLFPFHFLSSKSSLNTRIFPLRQQTRKKTRFSGDAIDNPFSTFFLSSNGIKCSPLIKLSCGRRGTAGSVSSSSSSSGGTVGKIGSEILTTCH